MGHEAAVSRRLARMRGHGGDGWTLSRLAPLLGVWLALYAIAIVGGLREVNSGATAQSLASAPSASRFAR